MKLSSLKFDLPKERIAQHPPKNREDARLMVVHKNSGKIEHRVFKDLPEYLKAGDALVINDSKTFPARLLGKKEKTGAEIEVVLLRELNKEDRQWDVLVNPARKIRVGNKLYFGNMDFIAEISDNTTSRGRTMRFLSDYTTEELYDIFENIGKPALPKWILDRDPIHEDKERYQTVYAKNMGAVVPPFSGFHFTKYITKLLELNKIKISPLTLYSSLNDMNFIDVEDITKYKVSSEHFKIEQKTVDKVNEALDQKRKVCAVGVSSMKALESSCTSYSRLKENEGWTSKFIMPDYKFKITNALISNFHLPKTVLFVSVAAFMGRELMLEAYSKAVENKYNFFVYGDSMLII